jgi:3-oxoacyl-[acyl-carrier protein] reductase
MTAPLPFAASLLRGQTALVTGASRGIGRASAIALAQAGARVLVNYVSNEAKAREVCEVIAAAGGTASPLRFDVAKPEEIAATVDGWTKDNGPIHILVNNAGITRDGLMIRYKQDDWNQVLDTNLRGAFFTAQALVRLMMKERQGSIVNISSIVGLTGNAGQAAYCAAKAGLIGLTKSMAKELAGRNIRVNAVAPGFIDTDMTQELSDAQKKEILAKIPLGRMGLSADIAHAVVYLASPMADYVTGQTIVVDGGMGM